MRTYFLCSEKGERKNGDELKVGHLSKHLALFTPIRGLWLTIKMIMK